MSTASRNRPAQRRRRAILPAPAGRTSGGFLVNGRLFPPGEHAVIEVASTVELVRELEALGPSDVAIVDSLFLFDAEQADALVRAARNSRVVLMAHSLPSLIPGADVASRRIHLELERAVLSACAGAVAPSAFMAAALNRRGLAPDAIAVVPPAPVCDGRELIASDEPPVPDPTRLPGPGARLLTVANWTPAKGIAHIVHALTTLADLEWRWTLVGGRGGQTEYARRITGDLARAGLTERVELVETVPPQELRAYYRRADLFILPSLMESYGLVFAEALSYRVPVVGYRCAAVEEVVSEAGLLVPAGRADLLAQAIRGLLSGDTSSDPTGPSAADLRSRAAARAESLPRWPTVRSRATAAISRMGAATSQRPRPGANAGEPAR